MAINDVWRVAIVYTVAAQLHVNVVHYRETFNSGGLGPQAVAIEIAGFMKAEAILTFLPLIPDTGSLDRIEVRGVTHANIGFTDIAGNAGGNFGTQLLPPQCSGVISKLTNKFGRSFRGRNYQGGAQED